MGGGSLSGFSSSIFYAMNKLFPKEAYLIKSTIKTTNSFKILTNKQKLLRNKVTRERYELPHCRDNTFNVVDAWCKRSSHRSFCFWQWDACMRCFQRLFKYTMFKECSSLANDYQQALLSAPVQMYNVYKCLSCQWLSALLSVLIQMFQFRFVCILSKPARIAFTSFSKCIQSKTFCCFLILANIAFSTCTVYIKSTIYFLLMERYQLF